MASLWGGSDMDVEGAGATDAGAAQLARDAMYYPLRLSAEERTMLTLCEGALSTSEYTDNVDVLSYGYKSSKILQEFTDLFQIMAGLAVASDYRAGEKMCADREIAENAEFFASAFEIVRRYKIMNPGKLRTDYGKLVHVLQDAADPSVQRDLQMECIRDIRTVHSLLEARGALSLLADPRVCVASMSITRRPTIGGSAAERAEAARVAAAVAAKNEAVSGLVRDWGAAAASRAEKGALPDGIEGPAPPPPLAADEVKLVLDSIAGELILFTVTFCANSANDLTCPPSYIHIL